VSAKSHGIMQHRAEQHKQLEGAIPQLASHAGCGVRKHGMSFCTTLDAHNG
jgi:hypothetical protein